MSSPPPNSRQARFARFSKEAVKVLDTIPRDASSPPLPLILLTGGLRTPELLNRALGMRHAQLLGIGRGSVLSPDLPSLLQEIGPTHSSWNQPFRPEPVLGIDASWCARWFWKYLPSIPLVGAGVEMAYYVVTMRRLATSGSLRSSESPNTPVSHMGGLSAVFWMWIWIEWTTVLMWGALVVASLVLLVGIVVYN